MDKVENTIHYNIKITNPIRRQLSPMGLPLPMGLPPHMILPPIPPLPNKK